MSLVSFSPLSEGLINNLTAVYIFDAPCVTFFRHIGNFSRSNSFCFGGHRSYFLQQQQILFFAMDKPPPVTRLALAILTSVLWGYIFSPITSCASILLPNYLKFQFQISFSLLCFFCEIFPCSS